MSYLTDGTSVVSLCVAWDSPRNSELIIDRARTRSGRNSDYLWGSFDGFQLNIINMPNSDTAIVNDWWEKSDQLNLYFDQTSYDVYIVSQTQPFKTLTRPYQNEQDGVINLESI